MQTSNPFDLPEPYVRAVSQQRLPTPNRISVTELIAPPQQRALWLEHYDEAEQVAGQGDHDAFHGNAVHEYLRKFADGQALAEHQLSYRFEGVTVHGTPDHVDFLASTQFAVLIDWKTTRVRALRQERREWEEQTNLYAHLLRLNGYEVVGVVIWAFLKDWDPARLSEPDYPRAHAVRRDIALWNHDEAQAFLEQRLRLHRSAQLGGEVACSADERWQRRSWAVYSRKGDRGRAARVLDSADEARAWAVAQTEEPRRWGDWWEVEGRQGPPIRCESYCKVARWCPQYQKERAEAEDEPLLRALEASVGGGQKAR